MQAQSFTPTYNPERMAAIATKEAEDAGYRCKAGVLLENIVAQRNLLSSSSLAELTSELLNGLEWVHDKVAVARFMVDCLLQADDVALCSACFPRHALDHWVMDNTNIVFRSCPKTAHAWMTSGSFGSAVVLSKISQDCQETNDHEKAAILAGKTNNPLHRMMPVLLSRGLAPWSTLSPAWIGQRGSLLRERAVSLGWEPNLLMGMLFASIWQRPEPWLANVRYPYSIVVCKWILDVMRHGPLQEDPEGYFSTKLQIVGNADSLDVAMAKMLIENSPVPIVYTLAEQFSAQVVDLKMQCMLRALVHLRATPQCMPSFAQDICQGTVFVKNVETFSIDELI